MITLRTLGLIEVRDAAGQPVAVAPKPLALLLYLALARPSGPQRRDRLAALFYPDADDARARHALRQLLAELRAVLGGEMLPNGDRHTADVQRAALACDAWTFEQALAAGDFRAAVTAYGGPFLEGFHLAACPDFEAWVAAERMRLRRGFTGALEQLALRASAEGRAQEAADWWRILLAHEPYASSVTLGLMEALAVAGDRAGALEAAKAHAQRLREELGATPSSEVEALAERLQTQPIGHTGTTPTVAEQLAAALADRYRLEGLVAVGGMALVYKAYDLAHDRAVAIKVLRPELAAALGPDRFLQEITVTTQLDHPGIVPVYDLTPCPPLRDAERGNGGTALLAYVMPFIAGESLRARLEREGPFPLDDALRITREVADALGHAHGKGIVHRDIKPENILLTAERALVTDFGIARALEQAGSHTLTAPGVALGTPAYMSPEQAGPSGAVDARSDVYALGCVLYELLAGHPPFHGTTAQELLARHARDPVPSLKAARPSIPEPLEAAVYTALAKHPADRFPSATDLGRALAIDLPVYQMRAARRRLLRRLGVGVVAAAALITAVAVARSATRPSRNLGAATPLPYTVLTDVEGSAPAEVREAVRQLVGTTLESEGLMQPLSPSMVREGLAYAMLPDSTLVTAPVARELAVRGSVPSVVAVTLDRLGRTYTLSVSVIAAEADSTLATSGGTAASDEELTTLVNGAVGALLRRFGRSAGELAQAEPFGFRRAATASFEAFLAWRECRRWGNVYPSRAIPECEAAIARDSSFAAAWFDLGRAYHQFRRLDSAYYGFREARRYSGRFGDLERNFDALLHYMKGDLAAAARLWEPISPNNYCLALYCAGQLDDAVSAPECSDSALRAQNPTRSVEYARALVAAGYADSARRVTRASSRQAQQRIELWIASQTRDWQAADSLGREHAARVETALVVRLAAVQSLASAKAARGAVGEAQRILAANDDIGPLIAKARALLLVASGRASPETASTVGAPGGEDAVHAALLAAARGDTARARRLLDRTFATDSSGDLGLVLLGPHLVTRALIHSRAEAWQATLDALYPLRERIVLSREVELLTRWLAAAAFERLGNADSAASYFERLVNPEPLMEEGVQVGIPYSFALFRLGGLYARLGQRDRAVERYRAFLQTFTEPDPEYRWMVEEVRAQLARLEGTG